MRTEKVLDYVSWAVLILTSLLLRLASRFAENIVFGKKFVLHFAFLGLVLAIAWTIFLYKTKPAYYQGGEKRGSAVLSLFFSIVLLTIFGGAFITYQTGKANLFQKEAIVLRKGSNFKTRTGYVHLLLDGREERFNPRPAEYEKINNGDTLLLTMGGGKTRFDFIYEFKKK